MAIKINVIDYEPSGIINNIKVVHDKLRVY